MFRDLKPKHLFCFLIASYIFFFAGNGILGLTHPDEVFYAQTAKEMLQKESWLVPYLFDGPNFEKPIFSYWLLMAAFAVFGVSSFSARFFPALFAVFGVIAIYLLGKNAFRDNRKGLYAAFILMSSVLFVGLGRSVFTDMFFTVWIECSLGAFYWAYSNPRCKTWGLILFWLCAGLAALTKGILGMLIPALVIFIFLALRRELNFIVCSAFGLGFLLSLLVALPWYVFIIQKFGQIFIQEFFYNDHVRRLFEAEHRSNDQWFFYPLNMVGLMAPWCIFVVWAFAQLPKRLKTDSNPIYLFLAIWIGVVFCIFQAAHSKLVSYIFPLFPALALLAADFVAAAVNERKYRWLFLVSGLLFPLAGIVGAIAALTVFSKYIPSRFFICGAFSFFVLMAVMVLVSILKKDGVVARLGSIMIQIPLLLAFALSNHGVFDQYASSKQACEYLLRHYQVNGPILCSKNYLRSTRFFTDKEVVMLNVRGHGKFFSPHPVRELKSPEEIATFFKDHPVVYGVLVKKDVKQLQDTGGHVYTTNVLAILGDEYLVEMRRFI